MAAGVVTDQYVDQYHQLHPRASKEGIRKDLRVVFDNHRAHKCPELLQQHAGISPSQILPHPPLSPDFNQPVEHSFGRVKPLVRANLRKMTGSCPTEKLQEMVQQAYMQVNSQEVVAKDAARLRKLWKWVEEHHGEHAPKSLS